MKRVLLTISLLALLVTLSWAAVSYVAGDGFSDDTSAGSHTLASFTVASGSNRLLVLGYGDNGSEEDIDTVVFNTSESLTSAKFDGNFGGFAQTAIWYLAAPSVTAADIVVTLDGGDSNRSGLYGISLANVNQGAPIGDTDGANGTTTTTSSLTLSTTSGDLVISCLTVRNGAGDPGALTLTDGGTEIEEILEGGSGNLRFSCAYEAASGASVTTAWSWTTSTGWSHTAAVVQQAGAAGGGAVRVMHLRRMQGR